MSLIDWLNSWLNNKVQLLLLASNVDSLNKNNSELQSKVAVLEYRLGELEKTKTEKEQLQY